MQASSLDKSIISKSRRLINLSTLHDRNGKGGKQRGGCPAYGASQLAALPVSPLASHRARRCAPPGSLVQIVPRRLRNGRERSSPHAPTQRSANPARPLYRSLPGPTKPTFPIRQASSGSSARRLPRIWEKPARRAAWSH